MVGAWREIKMWWTGETSIKGMESDRYGKTSWIKRHKGVVLWGDMKYVSVGKKALNMLYELHLNIFRQERV